MPILAHRRIAMTHRVLGFAAVLMIAGFTAAAFGQGPPAGQAPEPGGQRGQRGFTFTTNGNGGIVDAPQQQGGQRGRGQAARPSPPAPRGPNGRVLLSQPPGEPGLWIGGITNLANADGSALEVPYQPWAQAVAQD